MLFNSQEYLFLFLPVTLIVYFLLNRWLRSEMASKALLIGASLSFYGWYQPRCVLLLVGSVVLNFSVGTVLNGYRPRGATRRRIVLIAGIAANIALLGYYKYADFVLMNVNYLFHAQIALRALALPLGLSFFTFIQISYLVDSYRNPGEGYDLLTYGLFGTFFPYILSGPIVHHAEIIPQLRKVASQTVNYRNLSLGLYLLSMGLFKKVVVADRLGEWASEGFAAAAPLNFLYAWVTSLCYTFQIYFAFFRVHGHGTRCRSHVQHQASHQLQQPL